MEFEWILDGPFSNGGVGGEEGGEEVGENGGEKENNEGNKEAKKTLLGFSMMQKWQIQFLRH